MTHALRNWFDLGVEKPKMTMRSFDPLGVVSGIRAYRAYIDLSDRSDAQLAEMGIDRADIPSLAFEASRNV